MGPFLARVHAIASSSSAVGRRWCHGWAVLQQDWIASTHLRCPDLGPGTIRRVQVDVLGTLRVVVDDEVVEITAAKERGLVEILALRAGRPVAVDELVAALWGDTPPATARKTLQGYVSRVRSVLGPGVIVTEPPGYTLDVPRGSVDADRFETLAAEGRAAFRSGDVERSFEAFTEALALWRGRPLIDLSESETSDAVVRRLEELRLRVAEDLTETRLALGQHEELVPELESLVTEHPYRETLWSQLMVALYRCGRQRDALRAYRRARGVLVQELGIEPGPELQEIERAVLDQDRALDASPFDSQHRFRPRTMATTVGTNFPAPRTSFIGREAELSELMGLVGERRLITLVGVGGGGKTRLAVELARRYVDALRERFSGGIFFVDLSSLTNGRVLARQMAEALGIAGGGTLGGSAPAGSMTGGMVAFLRDRNVLLVVDNCEHLLSDCAELIDRLLREAPGLSVLATSREPLAIEGEQVWRVYPLALPGAGQVDNAEAMQLLIDRMRAVRPHFQLDETNRDALVQICVSLDGIPLALELAAARVGHLTPGEIADRLVDRFELLRGGRRRVSRQRTLQATIDWSHDLLSPNEQVVFRRLAVFSGGFTLDAVAGVCMDRVGVPALDVVASLVERSLVLVADNEGQTRYRFLETVRVYAEDRLVEAEEADRLRTAHRDWFLGRLEGESWDRCLVSEVLAAELHREFDNLRRALEWCEVEGRPDLFRHLLLRMACVFPRYGHLGEADAWFDRVIDYEERNIAPDDWLGHAVRDYLHLYTGDYIDEYRTNPDAGARADRHRARSWALPEGGLATHLARLTSTALLAYTPTRAAELERQADRLAGQLTDYPLLRTHCLWFKAVALFYQRHLDEAANLLEEIRSPDFSEARASLAVMRHLQGRDAEALQMVESSGWALDPSARTRPIVAAAANAAQGHMAAARAELRSMVTSVRQSGWEHPDARTDCLLGLAVLAALDDEPEQASRLFAATAGFVSHPSVFAFMPHYLDHIREELDRETRHRCIDEGRALTVDEAIDAELARWEAQGEATRDAAGN